MHKSQIFSYLLGSFISGIFIGSLWIASHTTILFLILFGVAILGLSGYHRTFGSSVRGIWKRKVGFLLGSCVIVLIGGIFWVNSFRAENSILLEFDRQVKDKNVPVLINGYVNNDFVATDFGGQFYFKVKEVIVGKRVIKTDEKTLVLVERFPEYSFGQTLTLIGTPSKPKNFSDFDYAAYLRKEGIRTIIQEPEIKTLSSLELGFFEKFKIKTYSKIFKAKQRFELALRRSLTEPHAAFIEGLLLGTKKQLPQDLKDDFAVTGTSHILAVSGYNVALVAEIVMIALMFFMRRKLAFWVSFVAIIFFVILTGGSTSVVRAAIMGLLILFATSYGRLYNPGTSLLLAAGAMLVINPLALRYDLGFQLSFAAVTGLFYISPLITAYLKDIFLPFSLKKLIADTLAAQISVLPLLLYYFRSLSLVALPANLLVLPFVPAAMLSGFITGILGLFSEPLGQLMGATAWLITQFQIMIVRTLAHVPGASIHVGIPWAILSLLYVGGIIMIVLMRKRNV